MPLDKHTLYCDHGIPPSGLCAKCLRRDLDDATQTIATLTAERDAFCERLNEIDGGIYDTLRISEEQWIKRAHELTEERDALQAATRRLVEAVQVWYGAKMLARLGAEEKYPGVMRDFNAVVSGNCKASSSWKDIELALADPTLVALRRE